MIFENEDERNAFEFMKNIASETTERSGCNDLNEEEQKKFGHLKVKSQDTDGSSFMRDVTFDFDVIYWLEERCKK